MLTEKFYLLIAVQMLGRRSHHIFRHGNRRIILFLFVVGLEFLCLCSKISRKIFLKERYRLLIQDHSI